MRHEVTGLCSTGTLYTYACVIGSLVFASHRMKQWAPKLKPWTWMPQAFQAIAVLLSFLLMNIEIADFFAPSGQATLIFEFGGHFGRDVTYSLSWSLFALAMMGYVFAIVSESLDGQAWGSFP